MAESTESLRETLAALHEELDAAGELDDESRELLAHTLDEIRARLLEPEPPSASTPGHWVERMREAVESFEDAHPDLVRAIDRVAHALSNVGF